MTALVGRADYENKVAEIRHLLEGQALDARCRPINLDGKMSLLRTLKEEGAVLLVLAGRQLLKDREAFEALLREIEVPLLLLGDGFEHDETKSLPPAVG